MIHVGLQLEPQPKRLRLDLDVIDDPNAVEGYEEDEFHPPCKSARDVDGLRK